MASKLRFSAAFKDLRKLFQEISENGFLTDQQTNQFNVIQQDLINYYNTVECIDESIIFPWEDEEFINAWAKWKKFLRQQHKFYLKPISEQASLGRLQELSNNNMNAAIRIIDFSVSCGYKGLFKPNNLSDGSNKKLSKKDSSYN